MENMYILYGILSYFRKPAKIKQSLSIVDKENKELVFSRVYLSNFYFIGHMKPLRVSKISNKIAVELHSMFIVRICDT